MVGSNKTLLILALISIIKADILKGPLGLSHMGIFAYKYYNSNKNENISERQKISSKK